MSEVQSNIEERIKGIVAHYADCHSNDIKLEASFAHDLGFDSLDAVETIMDIEDEFGIEISDEDAEKIATVQQAINYVTANVRS